jgi:hypothetical protein
MLAIPRVQLRSGLGGANNQRGPGAGMISLREGQPLRQNKVAPLQVAPVPQWGITTWYHPAHLFILYLVSLPTLKVVLYF